MDKYDRQLRLWGPRGQRALAEARICLIGAGPTGTETLKNLVLPGVGHVTIVDGEKVTEGDVGNNFFVDKGRIGEPRAKVALELLLELNPDVRGDWREEEPTSLIGGSPEFFLGFDLVVATQLPAVALRALAHILFDDGVPLVCARTYGLLGHVRVVVDEHRVVEPHPDGGVPDLRLTRPFPALLKLLEDSDIGTLDKDEAEHVPWPLILLQLVSRMEEGPWTKEKKAAFKTLVRDCMNSENVDEAEAHVHLAWTDPPIPGELRDIMADGCATESGLEVMVREIREGAETREGKSEEDAAVYRRRRLNKERVSRVKFWAHVYALKAFVDKHGHVPLQASLPDMVSSTQRFLNLSAAYTEQSREEAAEFLSLLPSLPEDLLPTEADSKVFLSNARNIRVLRYRSLDEEDSAIQVSDGAEPHEEIAMSLYELPDDKHEQAPLAWYLALASADKFFDLHGHFPGAKDEDLESDARQVWDVLQPLAKHHQIEAISQKHATEITRYGACEPHAVAAVVGAIASQEAIKLVSKQFVPIDNTTLFNGIASIMKTARM